VQILNPFRKIPFLKQLWQQVPDTLATGYYNDCKKRLQDLWESDYKHKEPGGAQFASAPDGDGQPEPPSLIDVINHRDYVQKRL
jgi:hypothetical protein